MNNAGIVLAAKIHDASVDGTVPSGANWHKELLDQMSIKIEEIRPPVISCELKERLAEYRGFRHVVRNVYSFHLNPEKLEGLIRRVDAVVEKTYKELDVFAVFLKSVD